MRPGRNSLILAGLLIFLAGIVLLFPARVAYQWFAPPAVQLSGIHGSVRSGGASELSASGLYLRDLRWRMRPLQLFIGRIAFATEATPSSGFVEADVSLSPGGTVRVANLSGALPLQALAGAANMPGLTGDASLQFESIELRDGLPVAATGTLSVARLRSPLIDPSPIGGYRVEFITTGDGVVASVEDVDAVFDLAGSLTINADRSYVFLGRVAATNRTSDKLRRQMRFLGTPDERGQHEIRLEGTL